MPAFLGPVLVEQPEPPDRLGARHRSVGLINGGLNHLAKPDLRQVVQAAVDEANRAVSSAESIRRFRLFDKDWTEESGHLTPSLELRRAHVLRDYRTDIESLYA